jgi:hypothetical protein
MRTPEDYQQAAANAAERWKRNPSPELREQIIATFRLTKVIERAGSIPNMAQLRKIWQDAFAGSPEFDFVRDDGNTY